MATSANSRLVSRLPRTAFKKGTSGNPRGRLPGTRNRATVEAREFANRLVDDDEYRDALRRRMIAGTAGAMEALVWAYAKGRPVDRVEQGAPDAFAALTNDELKLRMAAAAAALK